MVFTNSKIFETDYQLSKSGVYLPISKIIKNNNFAVVTIAQQPHLLLDTNISTTVPMSKIILIK